MEQKTAESGFAVPLSLEHAVPMEELNTQLRCVKRVWWHFSTHMRLCVGARLFAWA